jgi:hypothetical protein
VTGARGQNILLTGLPRSGTTLCCRLLNSVPGVVALHEPLDVRMFVGLTGEAVRSQLAGFFGEVRRRIETEGWAPSKQLGGEIPDNQFSENTDPDTERRAVRRGMSREGIRVSNPLGRDYSLVVKQPAAFTALLEDLAGDFPTYAVVRSPLAILGSWNSLNISLAEGRLPPAENLNPELADALSGIGGVLERQVHLLNWFFDQYDHYLPRSAIIHYENLVASGGAELARLVPAARPLSEDLDNRNESPLYNHDRKAEWLSALREADGACWWFYSRDNGLPILDE